MNKTPAEWTLVRPDVACSGSTAQARNVLAMALADIKELGRVRDAAADLADHYRRSVNVGPGANPTREAFLWTSLRRALAGIDDARH